MHLAHAHALRRQEPEAVAALLAVERLNPEGLRYNMLVRDWSGRCDAANGAASCPGLRGLADRLHLLV